MMAIGVCQWFGVAIEIASISLSSSSFRKSAYALGFLLVAFSIVAPSFQAADLIKILGISGFENAVPFKKKHWPNLEEREYRISQGHDSAAVLLIDGELIAAAAEERFSRKKHTGSFPSCAIGYCLSEAGLSLGDSYEIAHSFDYAPIRTAYSLDPISDRLYREVFSREAVLAQVHRHLNAFPDDRVKHVNHHLAHAATAYFCSGWEECLVLVVDGMGEAQSASVYHARHGKPAGICLTNIPVAEPVPIVAEQANGAARCLLISCGASP